MNFPAGFDAVGLVLTWGTGASKLLFEFLMKGIGMCIVVELVFLWEEGKPGASCSAILLMPLPSSTFLSETGFCFVNGHEK